MLSRLQSVEWYARYDMLALWTMLDDEWPTDVFSQRKSGWMKHARQQLSVVGWTWIVER